MNRPPEGTAFFAGLIVALPFSAIMWALIVWTALGWPT